MRHLLSEGNPHLPLLLYVGRLGVEKKIDRLKKLFDQNPSIRLAIVGTGPAESSLKRLFAGYPVYFSGQLVSTDLSKAFASADLFVMPSNSETLGFVVMESLASGVPVIGVKAGGLPDIIEDGSTGYLVEDNDDMIEFSIRTSELLQDSEKRNRFSLKAVEWSKQWSWETATSDLRNIHYRRAIENHKTIQKKDPKID
jgi:sulfoquinovosyltransferase